MASMPSMSKLDNSRAMFEFLKTLKTFSPGVGPERYASNVGECISFYMAVVTSGPLEDMIVEVMEDQPKDGHRRVRDEDGLIRLLEERLLAPVAL